MTLGGKVSNHMAKSVRPKERKTPVKTAFGKNVREKRLELGWSQEKLAEEANLHFTYISSGERGERNIALENIICPRQYLI